MKLLIITQKVDINDDNLGSFHDWIKKLAGFADINVIANYAGEYELPENAKIYSLGKRKWRRENYKIFKVSVVIVKTVAEN